MKKVRVGILGCNYMGKMHADCYGRMENVQVVAVCDINEATAEAAAAPFGAKVYTDGKALIEECAPDLLDICLPTFLHKEYAAAAMGKVPYIVIEKPVVRTVEEGEALLALQAQTGTQVGVGHVIRFFKEYEYLKQALDEERYGRLVNLTLRRVSPSPAWDWASWRKDSGKSGGAILDLHIHDIDYMLYALGEPLSVHSVKNTLGEANSYVCTACRYGDFTVSVEGTWFLPACYPFNMYYRAVFENAVLEYDKGKLWKYDSEKGEEIILGTAEAASVSFGNVSELGGYLEELAYFVACAEQGAPITRATLADGVRSLRFIIEHCY
ncbi:MAG: Gfo/Idh/MocA family oxidoreductase [Clostridia bacterium]|nr:Gfo/Idh/MocA family oxidoreductase [Clostridia bacterium]MBQ9129259.1 Gfo/Idh/MocA family oxidoreductase [Clostridia bacterium]